ncbi:hypothetical protein G7085_09930 [Tessaracoccus sp. HDW20]|uniref:hypothetical protein n=1 Tax=Tessaracoccus coleopterorum TaxID=2714950 RepID=UPI0018D44124|nr:hypothetical protein [Tessaracoccus coleopterorum]NHB84812.1 hypothetical protein [Tessaracoccus coleopterorum]
MPTLTAADREALVIREAADRGIVVTPLSRYWAHTRPTTAYGIVIGYPPPGPREGGPWRRSAP